MRGQSGGVLGRAGRRSLWFSPYVQGRGSARGKLHSQVERTTSNLEGLTSAASIQRTNSPSGVEIVHTGTNWTGGRCGQLSQLAAPLGTVGLCRPRLLGLGNHSAQRGGPLGTCAGRAGRAVLFARGAARNDSGGLAVSVRFGSGFGVMRRRSRAGACVETSEAADGLEAVTGPRRGILDLVRLG